MLACMHVNACMHACSLLYITHTHTYALDVHAHKNIHTQIDLYRNQIYTCIYIYIYIYIYINTNSHTHIRTQVGGATDGLFAFVQELMPDEIKNTFRKETFCTQLMRVCMYVCIHLCIHVFFYVCIQTCIYVYMARKSRTDSGKWPYAHSS